MTEQATHLEDILDTPSDAKKSKEINTKLTDLDTTVRNWAGKVVDFLPKGLYLESQELDLLSLFLAAQRRRNLELDNKKPKVIRLGNIVLDFTAKEDLEVKSAAHKILAPRIDEEIIRNYEKFCKKTNISPLNEIAMDWRAKIRFMAQCLYSQVHDVKPEKFATSPNKWRFALTARDLASDIVFIREKLKQPNNQI